MYNSGNADHIAMASTNCQLNIYKKFRHGTYWILYEHFINTDGQNSTVEDSIGQYGTVFTAFSRCLFIIS